jgi:serine/threonine-protein kinase RsbT
MAHMSDDAWVDCSPGGAQLHHEANPSFSSHARRYFARQDQSTMPLPLLDQHTGWVAPSPPPCDVPPLLGERTVVITSDTDIIAARQQGRALTSRLGFSPTDATLVATAISELARNIVLYAKCGVIVLRPLEESGRRGILVVARDEGLGIADVTRAMMGGYSTSGRLGLGLCGVRRLVDEFDIDSRIGRGTTITIKKWRT